MLLFELYRGPAEDMNSGPGFTHQPPYGLQLNLHSFKSSSMMSSQFQGVCISPLAKAARQKS